MTNAELKKTIADSPNVGWFNNVEESINFSYVNFSKSFKGISTLYEFVNQQIRGWEKAHENLPENLADSKDYFIAIRNQIIQFISGFASAENNSLPHYWTAVKGKITNLNRFPITYDSSQAEFLLTIHKTTPNLVAGAFNFLTGLNYAVNTKELLFGAILAYEFNLKDRTEITSRKNAEQKSISNLKSDFKNYLNDSEQQLVSHLNDANKAYEDYTGKIDNLKNEKETLFTEWFENTKSEEWQKWYDDKISKIQKLEDTYETKLKLEKPAKYWEKKSTKYFDQGEKAKVLLLWIIGITSVFLALILIISPNWIFLNVFNGNTTAIIRWSIVFVTLLTLVAFTVKALSKYMFSSYHLARDAEERHTLTFFYLALLKDSEVSDEDRKLIMQSLFSRVETGLLKEDSSPTMPSEMINKIVR